MFHNLIHHKKRQKMNLMAASSDIPQAPKYLVPFTAYQWQAFSDKYGICGLPNVGNTCYFNSCVQVLYHTPQLRTLVLQLAKLASVNKMSSFSDVVSNTEKQPSKYVQFILSLGILMETMAKEHTEEKVGLENHPYILHNVLGNLHNLATSKIEFFDSFGNIHFQNDARELVKSVLDVIHQSLRTSTTLSPLVPNSLTIEKKVHTLLHNKFCDKRDFSPVVDLTYGIHVLMQPTTNEETNEVVEIETVDLFSSIILCVPPASQGKPTVRLSECFALHLLNFERKQEKWLWVLPDILFVEFVHMTDSAPFDNREINNIDLSFSFHPEANHKPHVYDITAVIDYHDNNSHYTVKVKKDNSWFLINDTQCFLINQPFILSTQTVMIIMQLQKDV